MPIRVRVRFGLGLGLELRRCSPRVSSMGNSNLVRCCLTWRCEVNGEKGPAGISYNEVDSAGKVCFSR